MSKTKFSHEDIDRMFEEALGGTAQQSPQGKMLQALVNKVKLGKRQAKEETR